MYLARNFLQYNYVISKATIDNRNYKILVLFLKNKQDYANVIIVTYNHLHRTKFFLK